MKPLSTLSIIVTALPLVSACVAGRQAPTSQPDTAPDAVYVQVTNHYHGPVEIHAIGSGISYRVGTVMPGFTSRFTLRPTMVANGPVELLARSDAYPAIRSGRLLVAPGDVVDFRIATSPLTSAATVRP